jgi:hypothetical protein
MTATQIIKVNYGVKPLWKMAIWGVLLYALYDLNFLKPLDPKFGATFFAPRYIVPEIAVQVFCIIFYVALIGFAFSTLMPSLTITMDDVEIRVPNLITRKYKSIRYTDISDVRIVESTLLIHGNEGVVGILSMAIDGWDKDLILNELNKRVS